MSLHIGIDLGTSGCRAIAINDSGKTVGEQRVPLPPSSNPEAGHFEQTPSDWWEATLAVLDRLIPTLPSEPIDSLCVDGTSATLLLSDPEGRPLTPALMYNDSRCIGEAKQIHKIAPLESGAHGPSASLAKLRYLINHYRPKADTFLALHQADWISNRLAGRFGYSDENNTLKMGYDPIRREWPHWINDLGILSSALPQVLSPGTHYASLSESLCERWQLQQETPPAICSGTTDSVAAAVASGIDQPGDAITSLGTTLVLKVLSDSPIFVPEYGIYSHRLGGQWLVSGASNAGAGVLLDHFSIEEIEQLSREIDPSTPTGLDYYPLSTIGERFPVADPALAPRLAPRPESDIHFLQAILEGLSRIEAEGYQKMHELGAPAPTRILTAGGGARNRTWTAIRQQMIKAPIHIAKEPEAAYGAAILPIKNF